MGLATQDARVTRQSSLSLRVSSSLGVPKDLSRSSALTSIDKLNGYVASVDPAAGAGNMSPSLSPRSMPKQSGSSVAPSADEVPAILRAGAPRALSPDAE